MDEHLLLALERVRDGANTHKIANLVGSYRSLHTLRDELTQAGDGATLLAQVEGDLVEVERAARAYLHHELAKRLGMSNARHARRSAPAVPGPASMA